MSAQGSSNDIASKRRRALLRGALSVFLAVLIAYIGLVIYRIPAVHQEHTSEETVANIQAQKLTMADVDGKHLPPPPDPAQVDATVAGIDANGNGIRDDVELAIFNKYPNDIKIRAAELQYSMSLQLEFTDVEDSNTLVEVMKKEGRGYLCIDNENESKEVENLEIDTLDRSDYREKLRKQYMTSFGLDSKDVCDLKFM